MQHLKLHASSRNELPPKDGWALPQRFRDRDTVQWIFWYWMTGFLCFRESIPLNMLFYFVSCMNRRCIWFIINNKKCLNFVHLPQRHSASCWNNLHEYCVISWSTYTHDVCVCTHTCIEKTVMKNKVHSLSIWRLNLSWTRHITLCAVYLTKANPNSRSSLQVYSYCFHRN